MQVEFALQRFQQLAEIGGPARHPPPRCQSKQPLPEIRCFAHGARPEEMLAVEDRCRSVGRGCGFVIKVQQADMTQASDGWEVAGVPPCFKGLRAPQALKKCPLYRRRL